MKNNYNERSWAIDVITEINLIVSQRRKTIRRAGGERTLKASKKSSSLFPDVLLFQDEQNLRILQGWELKMPDTAITDSELLNNAAKKASLLGLNSFLVWNLRQCALYVLTNNEFEIAKQWSALSDITKRDEVEPNRIRWVRLLNEIIDDLEHFFNTGVILSQSIADTLSDNRIIEVVTANVGLVAQNIQRASQKNAMFSATISEWWESIKLDYSSEPNAFTALSKIVLITWVNRFLFTHYLKKFVNKALEIDHFDQSTSVNQVKLFFSELTSENDFLNVYAPVIGEEYVDKTSWEHIIQLNSFLSELKLQDIDQKLLQHFFETLLLVSKRKSSGQYATPYALANYLIRIVMLDKTKEIIDPFCGTSTILRAAFDVKLEYGISSSTAIDSIWGCDKYSFPLHMSTLSLAKPEVIGHVINVFKSDVMDLKPAKIVDFIDPNTGLILRKKLPKFDYIVSNLPFVEAARIKVSNPNIINIVSKLSVLLNEPKFSIPSKSDLIAYLPYYLWYLLSDNGRAGLIISNSWLGTQWGNHFRRTLSRFFKITQVVTSANGKWFANAEVVTNIIVLEKRGTPLNDSLDEEETSFITITESIDSLDNKVQVATAANQTLLKKNGVIKVRSLSKFKMDILYKQGLGWSSYFSNLNWFDRIKSKLVKANKFFDINRG